MAHNLRGEGSSSEYEMLEDFKTKFRHQLIRTAFHFSRQNDTGVTSAHIIPPLEELRAIADELVAASGIGRKDVLVPEMAKVAEANPHLAGAIEMLKKEIHTDL